MNVIFHLATAFSIAVIYTDKVQQKRNHKSQVFTYLSALTLSLLSHGVLDMTPHCYPINPKLDVVISTLVILAGLWFIRPTYKLLFCSCFFFSILSDIIDLSPQIANSHLGFHLPIYPHIFPWHWKIFSGSIYNKSCLYSNIFHILLICLLVLIFYKKRRNLQYAMGIA